MADVGQQLQKHFRCEKCSGQEAVTNRISASGTGLSKMLDIQHNHFVVVACQDCGYTEMYDEAVLEEKGNLGNALDALFG